MQPVNVFPNPGVVGQPVPTPPVFAPPPPVVPVYPEAHSMSAQQAYTNVPKKRRKPSPPPAPPVTTLLVTEEKAGMQSAAELGVIGGK